MAQTGSWHVGDRPDSWGSSNPARGIKESRAVRIPATALDPEPRVIILLGAPGCGKGTQSKRISESLKIPVISSGDILRANIRGRTELGLLAQRAVDSGALVPDELIFQMLLRRVSEADCRSGFVLDGVPRTIRQAEFLESRLLRRNGYRIVPIVVSLEMDDQRLLRRISGRRVCPLCAATYNVETNPPLVQDSCDFDGATLLLRSDDREETFARRLAEYRETSFAIRSYFSGRSGSVQQVDSDQPIEEVTSELLRIIHHARTQVM
jgi:adenylate kinase